MSKKLTPKQLLKKATQKFRDPQVFIAEVFKALVIICNESQNQQLETELKSLFIKATTLPKDKVFEKTVEIFFTFSDVAEAVYSFLDGFSDFVRTKNSYFRRPRPRKSKKTSGAPAPLDSIIRRGFFGEPTSD